MFAIKQQAGRKAVAGGGGWSPADLSGLAAWWDAADASTFTFSAGTVVSEWRDKSGNGHHLTQTTDANRPSRSATRNGSGAVAFDGSNDYLSMPNLSVSQPLTVFSAWKSLTGGGADKDLIWISGVFTVRPRWASAAAGPLFFAGGTGFTVTGPLATGDELWVVTFNGASSTARLNGVGGYTGNPGSNGMSGAGQVGAANADGLHMELYDLAICSGVSSADDVTDFEDYVATKWGF